MAARILFGEPTMADAMYAPVCTRFLTYDVELDPPRRGLLRDTILAWPADGGMDRRRAGRARRDRRARSRVLSAACIKHTGGPARGLEFSRGSALSRAGQRHADLLKALAWAASPIPR